jgi:hypothetical protein
MTLMTQRWTTFFTMPVGRVAVVALLLALASGETAYGQTITSNGERESLRGLGPVWVEIVASNLADAEEIGFSEAGLRAAVELQLRRNGVPLANRTAEPVLYVTVGVTNADDYPAILYSVELHQPVVTMTSTPEYLLLATWRATGYGAFSNAQVARDNIRDSLSQFVDIFSNDYLAVNPQP